MESQNLGVGSQTTDKSHPITDGAKAVEGTVDVVAAVDGVMVELGSARGGRGGEVVKRKRGRPPKAQVKPPPAKKNKEEEEEEEDVCFICFDGGSLVLCDRRGCPKAYHPACIKRDEAFFESAAKWNCGWHICSICQKSAHHMCYTCTYSLCRGCIRKADYVCVRGDKGFCTICMKTIMLIENNGQGEDGKVQADFDDKLSWEYLFKVYWVYLKGKLSLTLDELTAAKNPWKEASTISSPLGVHDRANDLSSITSATSLGNLEANESKRRKIDDEEIKILPIETVNTEKPGNDENTTMVGCKEWGTKELLDFVAHMKDGDTSVLSRFDVQALVTEYINRNNLSDPKRKNQIICDSRLKNLFGKSRVGRIQMLKLLEHHFFVKEDLSKRKVKSTEEQDDADWNPNNRLTVGRSRKPRNRSRVEERAPRNKLDEFAAVDVHNMNLIYLRRDLIEILLEDGANFHGKVVGSIVRIRISGSDQEHDMYRLVQVVGTSKVDEPYKINSKLTDVMLEVLNLDKKEAILIDAISDQEFSEEECRRLQQSIKCALVKHFTVGEIQEKAVALQPVKLNDWMEKEILRLNRLRDVASEKGHKKGYRECMEKLQLLKTPDERERRFQEIPEVHSDPKMNPDYESDDTEEYFNKEHGDHMESKYSGASGKNSHTPKKRAGAGSSTDTGSRSRKNVQPKSTSITTDLNVDEGSTKATSRIHFEKDALASTSEKSQYVVDCNGSTSTKLDNRPTLSSSVTNSAPEMMPLSLPTSSPDQMVWHYHDPNGKIQGPFSLVQLQRWSTTGYFPTDMKIWENQEDKSLLLNDVLKEKFSNYNVRRSEDITADNKSGNQTEGLMVCSAIPSSTVAATPYAPNPINQEKSSNAHGSSGPSFGQNWSANNNLNSNPPSVVSLTMSNESTGQLNTSDMPTREMERNEADIKHLPSASKDANAALFDLPGPTPKMIHEDEKMQSVLDSKLLIQDSGNPPSWSSASSLVVGGAKLPVSADGWGGCSPPVKREEWDSGIVSVSSFKPLDVAGDHVATPTSNIDQNIQPTGNDLPTWHGMGEMIEFSTLAEESVSDLLAEVDAMESQYGLPSPTSRRNSFVDDLFNDEFSPTPDQGTRSDGFSSSGGDIHLPCHSTTTTTTTATDEHIVGSSHASNISVLEFMKTSNGLQQHSLISSEINAQIKPSYAVGIPQREHSEDMGFKWPEMEGMIDINRSAKAEGDEGEMETKASDDQVKVKRENGNVAPVEMSLGKAGGVVVQQLGGLKSCVAEPMQILKSACAKLVTKVAQGTGLDGTVSHRKSGGVVAKAEEDGEFIQLEAPQAPQPPLPPPLTLGLDPFEPHGLGLETMQGELNHSGRCRGGNIGWDQNQRRHGGEREKYNSPRERSHHVEDPGRSRNTRSGGGGSSRPQRVCRFYESGRCKKGASCKYLHQ